MSRRFKFSYSTMHEIVTTDLVVKIHCSLISKQSWRYEWTMFSFWVNNVESWVNNVQFVSAQYSVCEWTIFSLCKNNVCFRSEHCSVYEWTISTTSLSNINQFTIYTFIIVNNNYTFHEQFVNNQLITYLIQVNIISDIGEQC